MVPRYPETWSQRHMKVRLSEMKCFWDVQLIPRATDSMLWLEGRRSLDANPSLSNLIQSA